MPSQRPLTQRAEHLRVLLGDRAPWLVPWLPVLGVLLGLAAGALVWGVAGTRVLLVREVTLAVGAALGLALGFLGRTRLGRWLVDEVDQRPFPADLPREFRHLRPPRNPREEALDRHRRL